MRRQLLPLVMLLTATMFAFMALFRSFKLNVSIAAQTEDEVIVAMPIIIQDDIARRTNAASALVRRGSSAVVLQQEEPQLRRHVTSSDATVMVMAQGYNLLVHKRFVGTLRKTGFTGTM